MCYALQDTPRDSVITYLLTSQVSELFSFECKGLTANKASSTFTVANATTSNSFQERVGIPIYCT